MCEIHFRKCTSCKNAWEERKKLASCEVPGDPDSRCPPSLCMYVGSVRRPVLRECEGCRERREAEEEEQQEVAGRESG